MNIGLIGAGTIGKFLLEKINIEKRLPGFKITSVLDERSKSKQVLEDLSRTYEFDYYNDLNNFLNSPIDIVVECANVELVKQYAKEVVKKKDLFIISIGALVDIEFFQELQSLARSLDRHIYLPSGAIGGLDVIKSANVMGGIETVSLTTRKPAEALTDEKEAVVGEKVLFEGAAKEAIMQFPKNANVSIILSLAGVGVEDTKVKIILDPTVEKNIHEVKTIGDFGEVTIKLENNPSPTNPKTSYLTALSILSALKSLDDAIKIG